MKIYKIVLNKISVVFEKLFGNFFKKYLKKKRKDIVLIGEPSYLINKIKEEVKMLLSDDEAVRIYWAVKSTKKIDGEIAEVGVYQGGSAKLICEVKNAKNLYLFDTFEGLPEVNEVDNVEFYKGAMKEPLENIKYYLREYKNVYFYKGIFPDTAKIVESKYFSFVHLDVDLYKSTLDCLDFFYPRMSKGGIIISHDYPSAEGVKKAFDEFFKDRPESIIRVSINQCLIVKT